MSLPQHRLVVRRQELEATRDAAAILAEARTQAAAVLEDARRKGFEEGMGAGTNAAAQMTQSFAAAIETYWAEREHELVTVALAIAHRVIAHLPPEDILRGVAETALAEHRHDTSLILRTDPETASVLRQLLGALPDRRQIDIRSEAALQPGRIVLAHAHGHTEAGLLEQFRTMLAQQPAS